MPAKTPATPLSTAALHVLFALADGPRHRYAIMQAVAAEVSRLQGLIATAHTKRRLYPGPA